MTMARASLLAVAVAALLLAVWLGDGILSRATSDPNSLAPQWSPMFGWMAGFGGTGLALMYLIVSAVGVKGLWNEVSRVKLLIAATVGVTVAAGAVFGAVYQASSPLDTVPWALLGWILLGLGWAFIARRRRAPVADEERVAAPAVPAGD